MFYLVLLAWCWLAGFVGHAETREGPALHGKLHTGLSSTHNVVHHDSTGVPWSSRPRRPRRALIEQQQDTSIAPPAVTVTPKFPKISLNGSRPPLGMALNGSAWVAGPCGPKPSALGYQCSWMAPGGAVLHWTVSTGSSAPPINRCTMQPQAQPNLEILEEADASTVHFALQAASKEQLHLAFVEPGARPYPNEGVHGRAVDPCNSPMNCTVTSTAQVEVLYLSGPGTGWTTGRLSTRVANMMEGWAAWVAADTEGQTQTLCLSRHVSTRLMKLRPQQGTELLVQYAVGDATNYMAYGQQKGIISIDLQTGQVTHEFQLPSAALLAHALLMLIAFGVLLPTGLLLARHKWLFVSEGQGLNPLWALAHFVVLVLCVVVGVSGMIVALVKFGNNMTDPLMSTHQVLGIITVGLSLLLVVMYGLKPLLVSGQKHAPSSLVALQRAGGVIAIAAGWTSLFLGCMVIHQNWATPYITWLLPCCLITALVTCAAVLLELRYQKLVRTHQYNPKTCTVSNSGPSMPVARIRTHREPMQPKKQEPEAEGEASYSSSPVIAAYLGSPAARILSRSLHLRDGGQAGSSRGSSTAGDRSSSSGGAVRRTRHSTPNAPHATMAQVWAQVSGHSHLVHTGFPEAVGMPQPADAP